MSDKKIIEGAVEAQADSAKATNMPVSRAPTPLVEDATVVGGVDRETGAPVIRPKTPDGHADSKTESTDPSE